MNQIVETLRKEFGKIERIDPNSKLYEGLVLLLDKADDAALLEIKDAGIKFVSVLALNRCIRRGLI